ncbi:MAG TPA: hypothetical protein VET90_05390 [Candidatus Binatus sp.]|nr:hypothetical protein [Candidatus Binatus sp.]
MARRNHPDPARQAVPAAAAPSGILPWLPSPLALGLTVIGLVVVFRALAGGLDPDGWWHVATGRYIVANGLPTSDPFSFTWGGRPWTPPEWSAELLMYELITTVGTAGAAVAFGLVAVLQLGMTAVLLRRLGIRAATVIATSFLGGWVLLSFVTVRPQVICWCFLAGLVWILCRLDARRPGRVLVLVPLFAIWANVQGLWVVGLGVIGVYLVFTLAGRTPLAGSKGWAIAGMAGATLAVMATPAGPANLVYPLVFVQPGAWGLANILEWQSPDFHAPENWAFLVFVMASIAFGLRHAPAWLTVVGTIGLSLGLLSARSEPVGVALASVPLALGLDTALRGLERRWVADARDALPRRLMEMTLAVSLVVVAGLVLLPASPLHRSLQPLARATTPFPVAAVDRLATIAPAAQVLAYYDWGGYVIDRLYLTGGRVFIDSRADMYPTRILDDYLAIQDAAPGWPGLVASYGVQAMLLRPWDPVASGPAVAAGWCEAYRDAGSVLLLPHCPGTSTG